MRLAYRGMTICRNSLACAKAFGSSTQMVSMSLVKMSRMVRVIMSLSW